MTADLAEQKRRLRRRLAARRRAVPPGVARAAGEACAAHLLAESAIRGARRVALHAALSDEVPTRPLFEVLAKAGLERLLPRTDAGDRLEFAAVERWEDLRPGRYGVLEPPAAAPAIEPGVGDVAVVPGLAFDPKGWRLGRGRGCYDRTFPCGPEPLLVGLAYEFQVVDAVPHDSRDRAVDAIVTERGMRWIARPKAAQRAGGERSREARPKAAQRAQAPEARAASRRRAKPDFGERS